MQLVEDLRELCSAVLERIPRMITLQDRDPDSPMRGCMHPAYWRDKSSDVADMRRQEAALTFAWVWKHPFPNNPYQGDHEVLNACLRALGFWTREQHADGTFDEWYKNEHGYATTAFSGYAVALTLEALGEACPDELNRAVREGLRKAGEWLATHDDWFKTNHEAVGIAALGAIGRVLEREDLLQAALRNGRLIAARMHPEGWSKEISGLDLGYSFLLAEYMAMHAVLTGETDLLPAIAKPYRFAADFLHPDLTTGAEYGICANPYFSRVATVALAPHVPVAAGVLAAMDRPLTHRRDLSATLDDDLRLARYAYQPLLAALLQSGTLQRRDLPRTPVEAKPPLFEQERAWIERPEAKLLAVARPGYVAWFAPAGGGILRVAFRDGEGGFHRAIVHRGFAIEPEPGRVLRNARYSLDGALQTDESNATARCSAPFVRAGFVLPPYWARVGLRVATTLPAGHRWSRWAIDQWRARKGTALNQSTAGVSKGRAPYVLQRSVHFADDAPILTDRILSERPGSRDQATHAHPVVDGPVTTTDGTRTTPDRRLPALPLSTLADDGLQSRLSPPGPNGLARLEQP